MSCDDDVVPRAETTPPPLPPPPKLFDLGATDGVPSGGGDRGLGSLWLLLLLLLLLLRYPRRYCPTACDGAIHKRLCHALSHHALALDDVEPRSK